MTGARHEGVIELADREVRVLYTNRALAEAEEQTGKSIIALAEGFTDGRSGIGDMAHVLRAGMEAYRRDARVGGRPVNLKDAFDVLDAVGYTAVAQKVLIAVAQILRYDGSEELAETDLGEDDLPNA